MPQRLVPLRPLAVTELLDGAVRIVWAQRRTLAPVTVPCALVIGLAQLLVGYVRVDPDEVNVAVGLLPGWTGLAATAVVGAVLTGVLAPRLASAVTGVSGEAPVRRLPAFLALALVLTVGTTVGTVALIVPGLLLWGWWAVAVPAASIERLGPLRALGRARRLSRSCFGRVWGTRALGWLIVQALAILAAAPFGLIGVLSAGGDQIDGTQVDRPLLYLTVLAVGQVVATAVALPLSAAIDVLIYTDLRMRREGLDLVMTLPPVPA